MTPTLRGIGILAVATLLVSGVGAHQTYAQADKTAEQAKADKQKSTEKKNAAKKTETQADSGKSAPMSGFRPDPQTNY